MAYTTPRTWTAGEKPTAAILNAHVRDNLNAAFPLGVDGWTTYTPTLTQSGTVTKTVTYAKYQRVGRTIVVNVKLDVTGTGTAGNHVAIGLPVTAAYGTDLPAGSFYIYDSSATTNYSGAAMIRSTTTVVGSANAQTNYLGVASFTAALAAGDQVSMHVVYEAAS